ncbi:MAG: CxxC-x17-CxxC domain-containing protein [Thermomicrobiales bacterium]
MFAATCVACGVQTTVPFQPRRNRAVFCQSCFAKR